MAPMSKEQFEAMVSAPTTGLVGRTKRCDWTGVRRKLANAGWTTDEARSITSEFTLNGKPMSRLRTRNYLLGLVKKGQAVRKLRDNVHIYFVLEVGPNEDLPARTRTPRDDVAEPDEESEEEQDESEDKDPE